MVMKTRSVWLNPFTLHFQGVWLLSSFPLIALITPWLHNRSDLSSKPPFILASSTFQSLDPYQNTHTHTHTHGGSSGRSLKSCACVSPVVWAIKVSIYGFCDRLLLWHTVFTLVCVHAPVSVCVSLCVSVCVNYSRAQTQKHFDLQHFQPSKRHKSAQSLLTGMMSPRETQMGFLCWKDWLFSGDETWSKKWVSYLVEQLVHF